ncbi:hypothetical protein P7K49_012194 [Saguinus oedipus]|uniref:Uncharacterized protein n=1 Tax=Saguinus oedipus TaxID=9490 RepID=A0ABQ9VWC5_SAGOE|nr:hypothetical protein P7K49_012194 [Saguinus oedipus]
MAIAVATRFTPQRLFQASILDLHSGALSVGKHFVNLYRYFGDKIQNIFLEEDFQLYRLHAGSPSSRPGPFHAHVPFSLLPVPLLWSLRVGGGPRTPRAEPVSVLGVLGSPHHAGPEPCLGWLLFLAPTGWDPRASPSACGCVDGCRVLCREVRRKVQLTIAEAFGISATALHLTKPTFFSRINSTEARTAHDEYWHAHVDKVSARADWVRLLCTGCLWECLAGPRVPVLRGQGPPQGCLLQHLPAVLTASIVAVCSVGLPVFWTLNLYLLHLGRAIQWNVPFCNENVPFAPAPAPVPSELQHGWGPMALFIHLICSGLPSAFPGVFNNRQLQLPGPVAASGDQS